MNWTQRVVITAIAVVICILPATVSFAQDSLLVTPRGSVSYHDWDESFGIAVDGDIAIVAQGEAGLRIIDISDPDHPLDLSSIDDMATAEDVVIGGNYAYAACADSGIAIVDISDPTQPVVTKNMPVPQIVTSIALTGTHLLIGAWGSVYTLDVSDAYHPQFVADFNVSGIVSDVIVENDIAYVLAETIGLRVLNVSDPANPNEIGYYFQGLTDGGTLDVDGDRLYVAAGWDGVKILDVSDPSQPALAGTYDEGFLFANDVDGEGDYAYVTGSGLWVLNVFDPTEPDTLCTTQLSSAPAALVVRENMAFVTMDRVSMQIFDVQVPEYPRLQSIHYTPQAVAAVEVFGNHACLLDQYFGLFVYDITDPDAPVYTGSCLEPIYGQELCVDGNLVFVASYGNGMHIIYISDQGVPYLVGSYLPPDIPVHDIAVEGEYAYLACGQNGLQVVDISNPSEPVLAGSVDSDGVVYKIVVADDYVFAADEAYGFRVFDARNHSHPTEVAFMPFADGTDAIAYDGYFVYASHTDGVITLDVSHPWSPFEVGTINLEHVAQGLSVDGDYLYAAEQYHGIEIFNIQNPLEPERAAYSISSNSAEDVAFAGNLACVAEWRVFQIYEIAPYSSVESSITAQSPDGYSLSAAYPNPFNAAARFTLSVPNRTSVQITLYNLAGQRVANLANGPFNPGVHEFTLDASTLASGTYFVHASAAGRFAQTQRVSLIR